MKLYLAVTPDEYELPIAVETNCHILAKKFDVSVGMLLSSISHEASGKVAGVKFIRVEVEDDEEKEDQIEMNLSFSKKYSKTKPKKHKWFEESKMESDIEL